MAQGGKSPLKWFRFCNDFDKNKKVKAEVIPCRVCWCSTVSYRFFSQYRLIAQEYGAILLALSRAPQLSRDVPVNVG
jgi:hypothetical protein